MKLAPIYDYIQTSPSDAGIVRLRTNAIYIDANLELLIQSDYLLHVMRNSFPSVARRPTPPRRRRR